MSKLTRGNLQYPEADGDIETDSDYEDDFVEEMVERCLGPPTPTSSE